MEKENDLLREKVHQLIQEKEEGLESKEVLQTEINNSLQQYSDLESQYKSEQNHSKTLQAEIQQLKSQLQHQEKLSKEKEKRMEELQETVELLKNEKKEINEKLKMTSSELIQEKKTKTQLSLKLQQLIASSNSTGAIIGSASSPSLRTSDQTVFDENAPLSPNNRTSEDLPEKDDGVPTEDNQAVPNDTEYVNLM
jgi:chromosome segregation ATPase